jgi:alkylated DNA repair dioxygenase AlkB
LICRIDAGKWSTELGRRTQQFGFRFSYADNTIEEAPAIPDYFASLIDRLCEATDAGGEPVLSRRPNQIIVNEYTPGQGINPHIDRDLFEDGIVSVSLLSDIQMLFDSDLSHAGRRTVIETDPQQTLQVQPITDSMVPVWLDRRSLVVMRGESRYKWSHEIPARAHDSKNGRIVCRKRRVSITFRVVKKQHAAPKPKAKAPAKPPPAKSSGAET